MIRKILREHPKVCVYLQTYDGIMVVKVLE